jgi:Zn-dependent M32 family carboxypeptidase
MSTTKDISTVYKELATSLEEIAHLSGISGLLEWDQVQHTFLNH